MFQRKGAALVAASALLACAGLVRAAEPTTPAAGLSLDRPLYLQSQQKPADYSLMGLAERTGLKLGDSGITIGGWIEGSYTYNFDTPDDDINVGRSFSDFEHNDPTLNQFVLFIDRAVDTTKFDIGGRIEWMYGADARGIHTNGLFDHYGFADGPNNQFDLTQAYVDVAFGGGLKVRAGKFVTTVGYEYINPNQNALFSRSFTFNWGIPFVQAGVLAFWDVNPKLQVYGGITRGWEQSTEDNNGAIDFLGGMTWKIDDAASLFVNVSIGPQNTDNNDDYRYLIDATYSRKLSDQLTFALNGMYAWDEGAAPDGDEAQWFGAAVYLSYAVNDMIGLNFRGEYFNDDDNARGLGTTVYEVTLGLDIKPLASNRNFAGLRIRPEVRWDYAQDDIFSGGTEDNQLTVGVDAILSF